MATKKAPKNSTRKLPAAAKRAAAKKTPSKKGGGKQASKVSPSTANDFVVLYECDISDAERASVEDQLAKFKAQLEQLKVVGFFRMPGSH
jgi:hypothetical protein